jgi:hypothetical protein
MAATVSSLKENADAFAGCHGTPDEQGMGACEEHEAGARRDSESKIRNCLICKSPFPSAWSGERVCRRCKSTSAWRSGSGLE